MSKFSYRKLQSMARGTGFIRCIFFTSITVRQLCGFVSLFESDPKVATNILQRPKYYLPLCDAAMIEAQERLDPTGEQTVKKRVHARITGVPVKVKQGQLGELVSISGITVRTSQPTILKVTQRYTCRKCKHVTVVKLEWERMIFPDTKECEACHSNSITARTTLEQDDCCDYQEIKLQEKCQTDTRHASYSMGMRILLLDDLVDKCRPGDRIDVCGMVMRKCGSLVVGKRAEWTTVMIANSIFIRGKISDSQFSNQETKEIFKNYWANHEHQPLVGRDNILASICPQIYGMYMVKLALAVILAGGVPKTQDSGTRVRGEPHLLLIGDPGTGKSQLLRTASRLAIRSVLTTGIGSTAAGLTAAAIKDGDGWHLEGGALVLADGGVCCIDEFSTMRSHDRAAVHEAMEQQTISVAKAGLVSTLNSRCTVIAATNPTGGLCVDGQEAKTALGNPLLSRFDLILILRDNKNPEWDKMISDHILKAARNTTTENIMTAKTSMNLLKEEGLWKEESLREYLAFIHSLRPTITPEASKVLTSVYHYHRSNPDRRAERTTVRLLDSLVRLAEGHARLMYRTQVELMDALVAAQLVGTAVTSSTDTGCPFPTDPMVTFQREGRKILRELDLAQLGDLL